MNFPSTFDRLISNLNPSQLNAVMHLDGPAVVFAGAGSGKTRVISTRILKLLLEGQWPSSIMAVTFTNKAANEMRNRLKQMSSELNINISFNSVFVCTFHSACSRILRSYAEKVGFNNDFTIIGDNDSKSVIKSILESLGIGKTNPLNANIIKSYIEKLKNIGITENFNLFNTDPETTLRRYGEFHDPELILKCFNEYQKILKKNNCMDFNDLLLFSVKLFKENPFVLEQLKRRFKYFLIDEFQDTNSVQFAFINSLSFPEHNLFVVGDDDQSIYSWRGADSSFIINFDKTFNEAKIFKLEENYRSTGFIIQAASNLITHNLNRAPKTIWTKNHLGHKIDHYTANDPFLESQFISNKIKDLTKTQPLSDFAILYRTNAQSRILEDSLRKSLIPYVVIGSLRFYERYEIKILLNYLNVIVNPNDDFNFEKTLMNPKKGIGDKTLLKLKELSHIHGLSLFKTCLLLINRQLPDQKISLKSINSLKDHINLIQTCQHKLSNSHALGSILSYIISNLNFDKYLMDHFPEDADDRILNTVELRNALDNFYESSIEDIAENTIDHSKKLSLFLEQVQLTIEPVQKDNQTGVVDAVSLLTIHAAKGLEYKNVFLSGLEEGILPHYNATDDPLGIEEERRLLYVAMTRAKEHLTISRVVTNRFRPMLPAAPSRFLEEIPIETVSIIHSENHFNSKKTNQFLFPSFTKNNIQTATINDNNSDFKIGSKVKHKLFGEGIVQKIEKAKNGFNVDVYFVNYGLKKLLDSFLEKENFNT